jgi:flagellar motility protein MotE (MotC chaperone)
MTNQFDEIPDSDIAFGRAAVTAPDSATVGEPAEVIDPARPYKWENHSTLDLIRFRDQITKLLPPLALSEMNLEEEMLLQFHTLRALQNDVLTQSSIALNQRVQAANAVASQLKALSDAQGEVYNQERFKAIEGLLIRSLSKWPEDAAAAFLEEYARILESLKK